MSEAVHRVAGEEPVENRLTRRFATLRQQRRTGLVTFITAGDPDPDTSLDVLRALPRAGADVIELGMPFSDPMADGPAIQASSLRALEAGQDMRKTLEMVAAFRRDDPQTPIVLMGYYNPIYVYGVDAFVADAGKAGVDGLIVVDLPPEESDELRIPAAAQGISLVVLVAPTTGEARLERVLRHAEGFVYFVSITGVTGTAAASLDDVATAVAAIRRHTDLPVAVGFGIRTPDQAAQFADVADAVVVGTAVVNRIRDHVDPGSTGGPVAGDVGDFVHALAAALSGSREDRAAG